VSRPGRASLAALFAPRTVAVVGASADPSKVGGSVLANLRAAGFEGCIVPVNCARAEVQGLPAVPSVRDIDGPVDVAVIAVRADDVLAVLKDCAAAQVDAAVVISAGFGEAGAAGREREAELRAWLDGQHLRVVGPNTLGWIRPSRRLNLSFAPGTPAAGPVGFFSQSGALCTAILDWARDHGIGFSLFASLGNQADVTETDVIRALAEDPETAVIAGYVEGVADGRAFFEALRDAAHRKPCILMKAGRSASGARAVSSHTGALAGADRVFDAAVRQAGAVRARSIEELFDLARALSTQPLPRTRELVIVTNGGGPGILAADAAADVGLTVAALPDTAQARVRAVLPPAASTTNPIDLVGDAGPARYGDVLRALDGHSASHLVILSPQAATDAAGIARAVRAATRGWTVPIVASFLGGPRVRPGAQALEEQGIPCYPFPERGVRTLAAMALIAERRGRCGDDPVPGIDVAALAARVRVLRAAGRSRLGFLDAAPLLAAAGIPLASSRLAKTPEAAARVASELGVPVALKIVSPDISHKTDVGGVALDLRAPVAVREATAAMLAHVARARPDAAVEGVLVQTMAPGGGVELVLGAVRDPQFGPVVVVGFGGIYVEVLDDTAMRLAPIGAGEARRMLDELRLAPLLTGARGRPPVALDALAETIARFSALAASAPEITELEINPLVATPDGVTAIDVRGVLT
jgi:acetate---CoA ligase (ADP-forming)